MGVELSHTTLIHSLPLKLSQTLLSGFDWIFARIWFQEASLSHFFAARKKEQLAGKNIHSDFTNVTRFELYVFVLLHHERLRVEGLRRIQDDDGWKFILFSGWLKLIHTRTYAYTKHDGLRGRRTI